jgi:hypothetical protein
MRGLGIGATQLEAFNQLASNKLQVFRELQLFAITLQNLAKLSCRRHTGAHVPFDMGNGWRHQRGDAIVGRATQYLKVRIGSMLSGMQENGQISVQSGLYRCAICGREIFMWAGACFPSCGDRDHTARWILCPEPLPTASAIGR